MFLLTYEVNLSFRCERSFKACVLSKRARREMVKDSNSPPECAGTYAEGEPSCDGIYRKEMPCGWREQCIRIRALCRSTHVDPDTLVKSMSMDEMERLATMLNEAGCFVEGKSMESVRAGAKKRKSRPRFGSMDMWYLYCHLELMLGDMFPDRRLANKLTDEIRELVVERGVLYPNEVMQSNYVTWMCKADSGLDALLIAIKFKPQLGNVSIWLPVEVEAIERECSSETMRKLSPTPYLLRQVRRVKSECRDQSYEGIGLAVGVMRRLVERRLYKLPEVVSGL